jgi:hypothetical protein
MYAGAGVQGRVGQMSLLLLLPVTRIDSRGTMNCSVEVTKVSYAFLPGGELRRVHPGERFQGRDLTPGSNPFRKLVLATPQGVVSFHLEDVIIKAA